MPTQMPLRSTLFRSCWVTKDVERHGEILAWVFVTIRVWTLFSKWLVFNSRSSTSALDRGILSRFERSIDCLLIPSTHLILQAINPKWQESIILILLHVYSFIFVCMCICIWPWVCHGWHFQKSEDRPEESGLSYHVGPGIKLKWSSLVATVFSCFRTEISE